MGILVTLTVIRQCLSRLMTIDCLKKYTKICERVSILMKIEFDSEPVYSDNDEYIKTKIKSYGDKVNTNFPGEKIPKGNSTCKFLSLIMILLLE